MTQQPPTDDPRHMSVDPQAEERASAEVYRRGRLRALQIVQRPEMLSEPAIGERLGLNHQQIADYVTAGRLLGLKIDETTWFPDWQFDQNGQANSAMPRLLARANQSAWDLYRVLSAKPKDDLVPLGVQLMLSGDERKLLDYVDMTLPE